MKIIKWGDIKPEDIQLNIQIESTGKRLNFGELTENLRDIRIFYKSNSKGWVIFTGNKIDFFLNNEKICIENSDGRKFLVEGAMVFYPLTFVGDNYIKKGTYKFIEKETGISFFIGRDKKPLFAIKKPVIIEEGR